MSWLGELDVELRKTGIPAARRRRIAAELADHLASDPASEERLGSPAELARRFADELGTVYARQAGYAVFLALVPLGLLFVALALTSLHATNADAEITGGLVLGIQLAFVGGTLGLLRAWRMRRAGVLAAGEARVIVRRALLGIAGGAITVVTLGFAAFQGRGIQWHVPVLAYAAVVVGALTLTSATALTVRAAALRPSAEGAVGDLSSDLGIDARSWTIALVVALAIALCIAIAGVVQADPIDGLARATGDGLLCLAGFAVLGRPLGLYR